MESQYIIIITVLSMMCLLLVVGNIMQWVSNSDLHSEVRHAEDKFKAKEKELYDRMQEVEAEKSSVRKTKEELFKIEPGDRAILPYNLVYTNGNDKHYYKVTYEVEILEVSNNKVKVKALDYVSDDNHANDPANKSSILNVINNKSDSWIEKVKVEHIIDTVKRREQKIDNVLN